MLLFASYPAFSAKPPKPGAMCSKIGASKTHAGKTFTCVKSGKKLIWDKGRLVELAPPKPTSTPSPTPTPMSSPSASPTAEISDYSEKRCNSENEVLKTQTAIYLCVKRPDLSLLWSKQSTSNASSGIGSNPNPMTNPSEPLRPEPTTPPFNPSQLKALSIDTCKMKDLGSERLKGSPLAAGFPRMIPLMQNKGEIKWAVVPIDFADLPGEKSFMSRVEEQTKYASDWISGSSFNQVSLKWYIHDSWVTLPGSYQQFALDARQWTNTVQNELIAQFWESAIRQTDKFVDYRGIQGVHFILPVGQKFLQEAAKGYAWDGVVSKYTTNEGSKIDFFTIPGVHYDDYAGGKRYWSYWVKEYTRGLGAPSIGARYGDGAYNFLPYDIQSSTEGSRYLSGWNRFLLDWLPETQIFCQTLETIKNFEIDLLPLNSFNDGFKMVLIKITETKMLIIESRRDDKFSCDAIPNSAKRNGVLVYEYDATLGALDQYLNVISPSGRSNDQSRFCPNLPAPNSLLYSGDSVTFKGISIESVYSGSFDRVSISK